MKPRSTAAKSSARTSKKSTKLGVTSKLSRSRLVIFVVSFAIIGILTLLFTRAATITLTTLEAETLTPSSSNITVTTDSTASGGKALRFLANATASGQLSVAQEATSITVRAKGIQCQGAPQMVVNVDGTQILSASVSATAWTDYSVSTKLASGTHTLSLGFTNNYTARKGNSGAVKCSRALDVDKVTAFGTVPDPTTITMTTPTNGATVSGGVPVEAKASGTTAISKVEFYLDGTLKTTEAAAPYCMSGGDNGTTCNNWDSTTVPNGTHSITAYAYDSAGVKSQPSTVSFTVNNTVATPTPTPTPTPATSEYPALPSSATLVRFQDFESGTVGQSFTANQCESVNNQIVTDPVEGKIWETWWDAGDPPVAAHQARCEMSDFPVEGPGEYIYRYKFKVPSDSYLPGTGWHYRAQFHGYNPSTSPPIAVWTQAGPTASQFNLRFAAGDSTWYQTGWTPYAKDVWHTVQIRVNWQTDGSGWAEFHVDGQPVMTLNGTYRITGQTLRAGQGTPAQVYAKYGLDGGSLPTTGIRLHGFVASFGDWKVN